MAKDLDTQVMQFRTRGLDDAGPFTFTAADALVLRVREVSGWSRSHALVVRGVDADATVRWVQVTTLRTAPAGPASSAT